MNAIAPVHSRYECSYTAKWAGTNNYICGISEMTAKERRCYYALDADFRKD